MLRVGLLGTGDAGKHHMRALAACEVEWSCVGVRDPGKPLALPAGVRALPIDDVFAACDALIIATPDGLHHQHAMRALDAGLHVLVEKPLALEVAHAEELVATARGRHRALMVGYHLRHHAGHELVRARLPELAGTVRTIHARWAWPDPATTGWRARGDGARWWAAAALGTHLIDLVQWLGGDIADLAAVRTPPDGVDTACEVALRLASGALASVACAVTHRAQPVVLIAGDAGEIECRGTLGARGAGTITHVDPHGARTDFAFSPADPYTRQLRAFVARCNSPSAAQNIVDEHAVANVAALARI